MTEDYIFEKNEYNGLRFYKVYDKNKKVAVANLPSATTILGETADKTGLEKWKKRVGEQEANRINTLSRHRGTVMHRLIELYKPLIGSYKEKYNKLVEIAQEDPEICEFDNEELRTFLHAGWQFFHKFYKHSEYTFDRVKYVVANEEPLWTTVRRGWAGTVDNVSLMTDGRTKIIDYKNARKPKKITWVEDYFHQLACYWMARWSLFGKKADGAEIWLTHEQGDEPQIFTMTEKDLKHYAKLFIQRRENFYQIYKI